MARTRYKPRVFLPENLDFNDRGALEEVHSRLTRELAAAQSGPELQTWLDHYGELEDAMDEEKAVREIETTRHVGDEKLQQDFESFLEGTGKWFKSSQYELRKQLVAHPAVDELPEYYDVYLRSIRTKVKIYNPANDDREIEDDKLRAEYGRIMNVKIPFEGKEWTMKALGQVMEEPDRARRQAAWEAIQNTRATLREPLDDLYDRQLALRHEIALAAGFTNYRDYMFAALGRFDYGPQDVSKFEDSVAAHVVPRLRELDEERRQQMGLETLRPWDMAVDPQGRAPLKPFATPEELFEGVRAIFDRLDPKLGEQFASLKEKGLLDLDGRYGKIQGASSQGLSEMRLPFTFMNATGSHGDVKTLLHEGGHDLQAFAVRDQRLFHYRMEPGMFIEFAEVASMAMELLGSAHFDQFYGPEDNRRARQWMLDKPVDVLPWIAAVDAFQNWTYTHLGHSHEERRQAWSGLMEKFGGGEDWTGHEAERDWSWQTQLHIYTHPLYYIEYGFAQDGALQVWQRSLGSPEKAAQAVKDYETGIALGSSKRLPELYEATGIKFDRHGELLESLMAKVAEERAALLKETVPVPIKDLSQAAFRRSTGQTAGEAGAELDQGKV